jgi:hypothetical protein
MARKPIETEEKNGKVHKKGNATAMTDNEFETYLDSLDTYAQKEAQVREVLYNTLTKTVTLQIKGQLMVEDFWKKLMSIFESNGDMTVTDTLSKLATTHYVDGNDMRTHITTLLELQERLAEMGLVFESPVRSSFLAVWPKTGTGTGPTKLTGLRLIRTGPQQKPQFRPVVQPV